MQNKQERNIEIYQARRKGASVLTLAQKYELSPKRIRAICKQIDNSLPVTIINPQRR